MQRPEVQALLVLLQDEQLRGGGPTAFGEAAASRWSPIIVRRHPASFLGLLPHPGRVDAGTMLEFRVTKYDPAARDSSGACTRDEWTEYSGVGRVFEGVRFTAAAYSAAEDSYVLAAVALLSSNAVSGLRVSGLENAGNSANAPSEGEWLSLERVEATLRHFLKGDYSCRLQGDNAFVHVGWDFYMYIGVERADPKQLQRIKTLGLYPERYESPHKAT